MAKIIGDTTATPNPRPDWAQTDETKADFIKNKPIIPEEVYVGDGDMPEGAVIQLVLDATDEEEALKTELFDYVNDRVASVIDAAPEALNTLNELAAALGNNENFAADVAEEIGKKVDKVDGKQLSTNDFTDQLLTKLNGIEASANKYAHATHNPHASGFYKVTVDNEGHISAVTPVTKADIVSLDIPSQDTQYTHPTHSAADSGLYKVTVDTQGHITNTTAVTKNDLVNLIENATTTEAGLLSASDKQKLDNVGSGSGGTTVQADWNQIDSTQLDYIKNKPTIPSINGLATTDYVDNKVSTKVEVIGGKGLSTNDFTDEYKDKVDGAAYLFETEVEISYDVGAWGQKLAGGSYCRDIAVAGLLESDCPIIDIITIPDSVNANKFMLEAWSHIDTIIAEEDNLKIYTDGTIPASKLIINIKVVR